MKIFKHIAVTVVVLLFAAACKKSENKKNDNANIEFSVVTVVDEAENYTSDTTIYNVITINYVEAKSNNPQDTAVVSNINKDFFAWLSPFFLTNEKYMLTEDNIKDAIANEIKAFIEDINTDETLADCETCRYAEFSVDTCKLYQTDKIVSIAYNYYQYSGGAHGYSGFATFNYDRQTAKSITIDNLSTNIAELTTIAEKVFVQKNGDIKDFWFENEKFYLPNIFYFTETQIVFYYSIYEIAPYAAGSVTVEIDYNQVKNLVEYIQ